MATPAQFLNLDVVLRSNSDLGALVKHLDQRVLDGSGMLEADSLSSFSNLRAKNMRKMLRTGVLQQLICVH